MKSPPKDLQAWSRVEIGPTRNALQFKDWLESIPRRQRDNIEDRDEAYRQEILSKLTDRSWNSVNTQHIPAAARQEILASVEEFHTLTVTEGKYELDNKRIEILHIEGLDSIVLRNCWIKTLICGGRNPIIEIEGSWIVKLHLTERSASRFRMVGGGILDLDCPGSNRNAFTGPVDLVNVFLPRRRGYGLESAQPYRNLRACLTALHNMPAAGAIHSAELAFERQDDRWLTRQLSYAYDLFSDYGGSVSRPLLWLAACAAGSASLIWATDGALPAEEYAHTPAGWRTELFGTDASAQVTRAVVYTLNSIVNPLGIFGRQLLVARETWIAAAASALCLLGTISLALFLLALRRRFKLQ